MLCRRGLQTPTIFKTKIAYFATLLQTGDTAFCPRFVLLSTDTELTNASH